MSDVTKSAVLVLNASYEPVSFCAARRAIILVVKNAAVIEEHGSRKVHASLMLPSVIRLKEYKHIPHRMQILSRKNVLLRDRHRCQYCGGKFHPGVLTLDHVMPQSRGGKSTWDNLVAACSGCNRKKADRTPEEADMPLLNKPKASTIHTSRFLMRSMGIDDPKWRRYLYTESDAAFSHQ